MASRDSGMRLSRSFNWLNVTQFLGALNDNVFRFLVVFFLISLIPKAAQEARSAAILSTTLLIFNIPFLLFSHAGGVLADRISKRTIIVAMKVAEGLVMLAGCVGIYFHSPLALYLVIFLMSTQSAIFGPPKYGIIPELVKPHQLSKANGLLVGLTFLAIIIGTFVTPFWVRNIFPGNYLSLGVFCVGLAVLGTLASLRIEKTPAAGRDSRFSVTFVADIVRTLRSLRSDRYLLWAIFGSSYFLFLGAFLQGNVILYAGDELGLAWEEGGYLFTTAALGIGLGAVLAGKLSGRNIEFGIVPVGAFGLTAVCLALYFTPPTRQVVMALLLLAGLSSGLFVVPLNAFVQHRSPEKRRGEILAAMNWVSFLFGVFAALTIRLLHGPMGLNSRQSFIVIGAFTAALFVMTLVLLPDFLVRFLVVAITKLFYRVRVTGIEHIPVDGPALLVSNHVTWVDALLIGATQQRRIRFVMAQEIFNIRWLRPLFRLMGVIPISPGAGPRSVMASLEKARTAMDEGYLVCIFAEGGITRNGNMHGFKTGFQRIVKGSDYPIIPVHIGGAWGSIFSYYHGRLLAAMPHRIPYSVAVSFGAALPATASPAALRAAVTELGQIVFDLRKSSRRTLAQCFARTARRKWFRHAMSDTTGKHLTFGKALTGSIALADALRAQTEGQDMVGLVLPATVAGTLANIAVSLLGKTPVNLNFTASPEAFRSAIRQCNIRTVISSKLFVKKLEGFEVPDGTVYIEDVARGITAPRKLLAALKALLAPWRLLARGNRAGPDDTAAVVFSSGSTGEPKGVLLSHHNIISNIEAFQSIFKAQRNDRLCAFLPFFHSFGLTVTIWFPLLRGLSTYYHPNPLDAAGIAKVVRERRLTVLIATPTFLLSYIRRASPEDFASLRSVVVGAEKLKQRIADKFEEKFGIRPLEGYGATELSPVGALNIPDVKIDRVAQTGTKEGSIGHPLPGVTMRIVDPDTGELLPPGQEGLLLVKGPNVMQGYLGNPEKTGEVLSEGWYNTGDLAKMDEDGFVFLLDRLSRYSKIGGEMVPHMAVEEKFLEALDANGHVVAVTAASDEKKGEQLVVFFEQEATSAEQLQQIAKESDLPNLWKPRKDNYFPIDTMPVLGSGKLDLKSLKQLAKDAVENRPGFLERMVGRIKHTWDEHHP